MSTFEELDYALKSRGWRYDRRQDQFLDGTRVIDWQDVISLLPRTLDALASHQDNQHDELCSQRAS